MPDPSEILQNPMAWINSDKTFLMSTPGYTWVCAEDLFNSAMNTMPDMPAGLPGGLEGSPGAPFGWGFGSDDGEMMKTEQNDARRRRKWNHK